MGNMKEFHYASSFAEEAAPAAAEPEVAPESCAPMAAPMPMPESDIETAPEAPLADVKSATEPQEED